MISRGFSEEEARALIVSGFADNVSKELPLEYAVLAIMGSIFIPMDLCSSIITV